ncbi:MAG: cytochrome c [Solirubrobacterales bacterium]|nr:cytochrome c [Solirubrobacterales bacterium]
MRRVLATSTALIAAASLAACGDKSDLPSNESASVKAGAELFSQRCAGCHTMDVVGAEGGASKIGDREIVDGPNFNVRKESKDDVLYAIRNGGFSGAYMPENIVVGKDADAVAEFLSKYAGRQAADVRDSSTNEPQDTQ